MKRQIIRTESDLGRLEDHIREAADATALAVSQLLGSCEAMPAFAALKFMPVGHDPLNPDRPLNVVEQLNQTFTYLASIAATRWLLRHHAEDAPFVLNLGTHPGADIESENGRISAETFAVTDPRSNEKLRKDIRRVESTDAAHKYVFYLSPKDAPNVETLDVNVVRLDHPTLNSLASCHGRAMRAAGEP